jgi:hypothetical protein
MNSNGQADFQHRTYPTGGVFMEERFYSFAELRKLLEAETHLKAHLVQAMGVGMEKAQEK